MIRQLLMQTCHGQQHGHHCSVIQQGSHLDACMPLLLLYFPNREERHQNVGIQFLHVVKNWISTYIGMQVCAVLKQVAEEVTQYGDDLPTGPKRELVTALLDTLPAVLQFLCQALSGSYQAASQAASEGRQQVANEHVAVLRAALGECCCQKQMQN